jgi:RNA polymerase sigma-70 factor (ECF subfamily)
LTPSPPPSDAELIRRAQGGDEDAFTALATAWHPRVFRWACGMLDDPDDADDVAQQVLVRLYTHLGRFHGHARFSTWLYQITQNAARDARRRRGRRARAYDRMVSLDAPRPTSPAAHRDVGDADLADRARDALARLPERQRAVFDLVELQGYGPQEAAALLGISPPTARTHLLRARRALRSAMLAAAPTLVEDLP